MLVLEIRFFRSYLKLIDQTLKFMKIRPDFTIKLKIGRLRKWQVGIKSMGSKIVSNIKDSDLNLPKYVSNSNLKDKLFGAISLVGKEFYFTSGSIAFPTF